MSPSIFSPYTITNLAPINKVDCVEKKVRINLGLESQQFHFRALGVLLRQQLFHLNTVYRMLGELLEIRVSDNGLGIDPDKMEQINQNLSLNSSRSGTIMEDVSKAYFSI